MIKKVFALLLALALGVGAQAQEDMRVFEEPGLGLKFTWPDAWYEALYDQPCLSPFGSEYGFGLDFLTQDARDALDQLMAMDIDYHVPPTPQQQALWDRAERGSLPLCAFAVEQGVKDAQLRGLYTHAQVLGEAAGTTYTLLTSPDTDLSALTAQDQARYRALLAATAQFQDQMALTGMVDAFGQQGLVLDGATLEGEALDNAAFAPYKLTMINIWATWCGPCVGELPHLASLYRDLPQGANLMGICTDGESEPELAKAMQDQSGIAYPNLVPSAAMVSGFLSNLQAFPTTIFVDSQGNLVGEPMVGVPAGDVAAAYRAAIEERLALLDAA